jgi:hypothetical protein
MAVSLQAELVETATTTPFAVLPRARFSDCVMHSRNLRMEAGLDENV